MFQVMEPAKVLEIQSENGMTATSRRLKKLFDNDDSLKDAEESWAYPFQQITLIDVWRFHIA